MLRHYQPASRLADNFFNAHSRRAFLEDESAIVYLQIRQVGQYSTDTSGAGQGQAALLQQLGLSILGSMGHGDNDVVGASYQIHGPAHTLDQLARHHPRGDITLYVDLEGTEHSEVDMSASDHCKGRSGVENRRTHACGHCLLACVDHIGIQLFFSWVGAHTQQPVLGLKHDFHPLGYIIRYQRGDTYTKVYIETILQLSGDTLRHLLASKCHILVPHLEVRGLVAQRTFFDTFLKCAADQPIDIDTRGMDLAGIELARLNYLLHFNHRDFSRRSRQRVEVLRSMSIDDISEAISFPALDDGEVTYNRLLQNVVSSIELTGLLAFCYRRTETGGGIERRDAGAARPHLLREGSLGGQLHFQLAIE